MTEIMEMLEEMGLTGKFKGYYYVIDAILIRQEMDYAPFHITKDIYPDIADRYGITRESVEFAIRNTVQYCWDNSREQLCRYAGYSLKSRPSNMVFIEILSNYIRKTNTSTQ